MSNGNLNKTEIRLLTHLNQSQSSNQMNSRTIRRLAQDINTSYFRLRSMINHLSSLELVAQGYKEGNANTYFITMKGVKTIEKGDEINHLPEE